MSRRLISYLLILCCLQVSTMGVLATEPCDPKISETIEAKTKQLSIFEKTQNKVLSAFRAAGEYLDDIAFVYKQEETRNYLFNKLFAALGVQAFIQLGLPAMKVLGSQGPIEMILVDFAITAGAVAGNGVGIAAIAARSAASLSAASFAALCFSISLRFAICSASI